MEPWERLQDLERKIISAVPPVDPPICHWLHSDAGPSYCRNCAWEARWKEMPTIGPAPEEPDWYRRSDFQELLADGIGGSIDGESDTPEYCETCGITLCYLLTDTGHVEELANFEDHPVQPGDQINGEFTYALTRIFMNLDHPTADHWQQTAALKLAEDTMAAINQSKTAT